MATAAVKAVGDRYTEAAGAATPPANAFTFPWAPADWAYQPLPPDRRITPTSTVVAGAVLGFAGTAFFMAWRRFRSRRRA